MHFVRAKGILSAKNGMNLYRGCSHGRIYCDSRSKCYHMEHAFEDIEVKENAIDLLEYALTHKRKKYMIGTGSMTDPYIPLEMEIGNVRKALHLIYEHGFGFTVITKSARILLNRMQARQKSVLTLFCRLLTIRKIIYPAFWICALRQKFTVLTVSAWG